MELTDFEASLSSDEPPQGLTPILQSLWYEAKGDWDRAHRIVQELPTAPAARVHAYLHRKEGDTWNGVGNPDGDEPKGAARPDN